MKFALKLLLLACAAIAAGMLAASCSEDHKPTTLAAPLSACKAVRTGRQRTVDTSSQVCAGYDTKMNCTVWMPIYSSTTYNEERIRCEWTEWQ